MNLLEDYIAYLKDNPQGYWFKRKLYGWGWTPARPQGWAVLVVYLALVFGSIFAVPSSEEAAYEVIAFIALLTILFILIALKTGESPRWQWGLKKTEDE